MSLQSRLSSLWLNIFRKEERNRDLNAELSAYVDLLAADKIRSGLAPEQARREALIEAGGIEPLAATVREVRTGVLLESILQDIRFGLRTLRRSPGFTIAAVLALALGIGANAAIFSVVNAVLLRPLPYVDPDRLVVVLHGTGPVAPANFLDWKSQSHSFTDMAAAEFWTANISDSGQPEKLMALRVTPNMFPLLGVAPILGRVVSQSTPDAPELVISYGLWQRRFGADPGVLGRTMRLNGDPYTIVGVMPRGFRFAPFWATKAEAWAPLDLRPRADSRNGSSLRVFARLKPDTTIAQAQAEISTITARLEQQFPGTNRGMKVTDLKERVVGDIRPALLVLFGAVGFVLLIACANVAHMLLARAAARRKETAVRTALGAARSRLIRQFLTESAVLSMLGGTCGLLLAVWGTRLLVVLSHDRIPRAESITLDSHVLIFVVFASLLTSVIFGIVPAIQASIRNPAESLKLGGRNAGDPASHGRFRGLMVGSEFAMALVLLIGAGLMIRSLAAMSQVDPGFNPHNVLSMTVSLPGSQVSAPGRRLNFYQQMIENLRSIPGVQSVSAINHRPLGGDIWGRDFFIEGRPVPAAADTPGAVYRVVFPGYFSTMQLPLLRGRDFTASDDQRATACVIINQEFAKRYWPSDDPIGKRITIGELNEQTKWLTIVGVAKNEKIEDWTEKPDPQIFLPLLQSADYLENPAAHYAYITLVARTTADPVSLVSAFKARIWSLDKTVPISDVTTMDDVVDLATAQPRFYMFLLSVFAAVALVLATVGIYGVMSYAVSLRTQELGVRIALGATRSDVLRLIVGEGMKIVLVGGTVGLLAALALSRLMSSLLYQVRPTDIVTFIAVPIGLAALALVACYMPAARATRIDPMTALRSE
jgi:predicted permease